uniref:DNA-dependent metalloprotease SPRTN n=1 Tax=Centroberyx gerrardi TaxID=166262 RepID=UPI003AAEE435
MDEDFLLAIQLQEQFNNEYDTSLFSSNSFDDNDFGQSSKKRKVEVAGHGSDVVPYSRPVAQPERPLSIVDATWEMLDPSPDVRAMFLEFNDMFFWGKLSGVEVKWSPRMTLCAGVCSYEGRGGLCSIRLSEPLLKLRPRKDLVETLLHEMIHALLFVTQNNRDRDGHGPEFCKHMNRINTASGTKISVYHTFHDEVDVYRQHWWRCDGPCQNRKPYFGYVKRAMNRAPSAQDPWWADHQRTCGGTYTKVKEPEGYGKKGKKDGTKDKKIPEKKALGSGKPSSITTGSGLQDIRNIIPFSGKGFLLGGKSQSSTSSSPSHKPPGPIVETSMSSPVSSPKKPFFSPPSLTKSFPSPVHSGLDNPAKGISSVLPSVRSGVSGGQKPPVKRSVSNTRVFVNINGSPVRISKPHGTVKPYSSGVEIPKTKQRSVQDLFNNRGPKTVESRPTVSNPPAEAKREVPSSAGSSKSTISASSPFSKQSTHVSPFPATSKPSPSKANHSKYPSVVQTGTKPSPTKPIHSKYFNDSSSGSMSGASGGGPASRKRPWDDRSGSANIFNFFQKTVGTESAAESVRAKSPAVQQRTATTTTSSSSSSSLPSSAGLHNVASSSSSSSSSSLTVSCPVCQAKVQESKINEHLDSCLS